MKIPRCFHLQDSFFMISCSRGPIDCLLLTFWHKPCQCKYLPSFIPHYYHRFQILATLLSSCLPDLFFYCLAPAKTYEKHYKFVIISAVRVFRLDYSPSVKLEKIQKTLPTASDSIWF